MAPIPIVLPHALPTELLTYVLAHQAYPTTLVICEDRKTFLESVTSTLNDSSRPSSTEQQLQPEVPSGEGAVPAVAENVDNLGSEQDPPRPTSNQPLPQHPLLTNTIHQLVTSRSINIVFIPTISHLRAYLATFPNFSASSHVSPPQHREWDKPGEKCPLLVIYGMLELHRDTSEWSAQGVGSTLASLVQVSYPSGRKVVIVEKKTGSNGAMDARISEEEEVRTGEVKEDPWEELIPLLSGSVRRAGLDIDSQGWSGRTVKLGRILRRWFVFEKRDWS
ncbi:hypothetical protein F5884DRAFT_794027 [Xylogone sp. PMI_703]|nr:hypothetical protein F5884DRAFT_794027 [Xylogone sp. PMI_703]